MRYARQYHFDTEGAQKALGIGADGWSKRDIFDNSADLWMEVQELWGCEEFSNELQDWCDNAQIGDVFEDDDIRVKVIK